MTNNNEKPCPCCGQIRPCPTEPGEWEYCEAIFMEPQYIHWIRASVRLPLPNDRDGQEGLRLWQMSEESGEMEMVWWPSNAAWRKLS